MRLPAFPRFTLADGRLALRATVAALLAYLLAHWLDLPKGYWAVLSAILVVQSSLGASLAIAIDRCLGTIAGGAIGVLFAILAGPSFGLTLTFLVLGTFLAALLAARSPSYKLAPVTVCVVMLADPSHVDPWISGLERILEISLGGAVGLACALLVLPSKAREYLYPHVADVLDGCAELIDLGARGLVEGTLDPSALDATNTRVRIALRAADTRAGEAKREKIGFFSQSRDVTPLVRGARRLWHTVIMLLRGSAHPMDKELGRDAGPALMAAATALAAVARGLAASMRNGEGADIDSTLETASGAVTALDAQMDRLAQSGAFSGDGASLVQLSAAVAACEHLLENLTELAARLKDIRAPVEE